VLKVGAIKIMLDGVIESRTADMLEPYLDVASKGAPNFTPDRLRQIVTRMDGSGWQIITHALGDGAIRLALDTYEAAARVNPAPALAAAIGSSTSRQRPLQTFHVLAPSEWSRRCSPRMRAACSMQIPRGDASRASDLTVTPRAGRGRASRMLEAGSFSAAIGQSRR